MNTPQKIHLKTKDYLVSGEEFTLDENEFGDILQTNPVPDLKKLSEYYKSENYISHTDTKKTFTEKVYHFIKKIALKQKVSLITKINNGSGKLLDIGSGTGDFLATAKQNKWTVFGVEPNQDAQSLSEKKGVRVSSELKEITETDFDVITLWHVLEHVPDLEAYIQEISKKLKPTGTLIIAVPNFKSKDAKHYKQFWAAYDVPRHLWHFSKTGIRRLFSKHHFELIKTKPMWFDAFYVSLLSEKYKTGKSSWVKAIFRGLQSNMSGLFTKEVSSHIYILKKK
ncbi:MAG: class I SAM-dependent methyltransferase [Flavobacteriaceae bacterium]